MSLRKWWSALAVSGIVAWAGCAPEPAPPAASDAGPSMSASETNQELAAQVNEGNPTGTPPTDEPVVARAGVGKEGQSLQNETGVGRMIAQPAITLFAVRQRAVFEIQIPQAMQFFEGLEGRKPKDHDEFMTKIIQANKITLPELPEGKVYRYHPDDAQLYVESAPQ